jgi:Arm DNA-binding domain
MLTEAAVQRLKAPGQGRREVRDARGLFLKISARGHRSWLYRFRRGDRTVRITLGPLDDTRRDPSEEPKVGQPLTLVEARVLASV